MFDFNHICTYALSFPSPKISQKTKYGEPHSPYTEKFEDDENGHSLSGNADRHANYSQGQSNQKPEWKRYKQYTRQDLNNAIQAVKTGMSALQASRLYKVPSRTLYDKVKKMGIAGARPINRSSIKRSPSNGGSPASFPYRELGISGTRSPLAHQLEGQSHSQSMNDGENGADLEQRERDLLPNLHGMFDPSLLLKAIQERGGGDLAKSVASLTANGLKNMGRTMSQSPPPVYEGSSTAAPNSPPRSMHEDDDDDDDEESRR